ncbi:amidase signature domain-containing protein [Chaetomium tenue]|uniref:Amidase signature domain-containing protein n=1 Tax=Chaetomium tenue TaxID=1854479 RepID=A0ACB7P2D2_9PEZI|nr:amidase signature domain-containing protein [Chaetomium globosum]
MARSPRPASVWSLGHSILFLLATITTTSAQLASTGFSVTLNDVYYFVSPFSSGKIDVRRDSLLKVPRVLGFLPVTVVQDRVAHSDLTKLFANWTVIDDVYQAAFSEAIFLAESSGRNEPEGLAVTERQILPGLSSTVIAFKDSKIPSGPYFLEAATGSLYPVYRLYEDFAGAFTEPLIPTPDGKFQPMSAKIPGSSTLSVGVPSRLYFTKTADKPLAGVRLGVKDIYSLTGVKRSNGNRAWYSLYPPSNVTGPAIQRLIDAGAQIVGLQKTSQFANGEFATADWVDYHAPFNPRGDGYEDAGSSSSGAGASISSYEWLDIAIGSDTGGSIRGPAGIQGLFGNRPSHGLVSLDHVMPLAPTLDTPGFILRDPYLWDAASAAIYGNNYTSFGNEKAEYPQQIYTLEFPPASDPSIKLFEDFAEALAKFVGGAASPLDPEVKWAATRPAEAGNATLSDFFNTTYATIITKEQTALLRDPFYRDYAAAHSNRRPFINPTPLIRWAYGDSLPASALTTALAAQTLFTTWFTTHILSSNNTTTTTTTATCHTTPLLLYPAATGLSLPRNLYAGPPGIPFGFYASRIASFAGVPDLVFPLGEVGVMSDVTGQEERLPVAVSVLAARGCDGLLRLEG